MYGSKAYRMRNINFANFSILVASLNAVVVFNLEVTHAARFALKTR